MEAQKNSMKQRSRLLSRHKVAMLICILLLVFTTGVTCQWGDMPIQRDYFRGEFPVVGTPKLNQPIEVTFTVSPVSDMPDSRIKLSTSREGVEVIDGDVEWNGDFKKDQEVRLTIRVRAIQIGESYISAFVETILPPGSEHKVLRTYWVWFVTTKHFGRVLDHEPWRLSCSAKQKGYPPKPAEGTTKWGDW